MDQKKYQNNATLDYQEGVSKGVRGTPTFLINDQLLIGAQPYENFTKIIEPLLGNAAASTVVNSDAAPDPSVTP
jgi:protein-disulfide isomerase